MIELIGGSLLFLITLAGGAIVQWFFHWLRSQLLTSEERRLEEETRSQEHEYLKNVLARFLEEDALGVYTELDAGSLLKPRFVPLLPLPVMDKSVQSAPQPLVQRKYPEPRHSLRSLVAKHKRLVITGGI